MIKIIKNLLINSLRPIALLLTLVIFIGSVISVKNLPTVTFSLSDKLIHGVAYLILTLSWLVSIKKCKYNRSLSLYVSISVLVYGIIIELIQKWATTNRNFDFFDMLANLVGCLVAFLFFRIVFTKKQVLVN